jgi:NADH dehydrogenase
MPATTRFSAGHRSTDAGAEPPHIVVLGAGFAGLAFAQRFPDRVARVTIVDRTNHHLFQPLLYQVAAAGLAVPDIAQPVRSILARKQGVSVLMDEVTGVDLASRQVTLGSTTLNYDYLIVALGGRTSYFGHPEWERHAPGLKTIGDALQIRRDVLHAFERAERTPDLAERRRLMTVVVIGGGPTGVELAGAFAELQRHVLPRDFRRIDASSGRVILIEAGPRILGRFSPAMSRKAQAQLESLGVIVRTNARVQEIRAGEVELEQETLVAANIIWAAGVAATPLPGLDAPADRSGRIAVRPDLSVPGRPDVFVIGDMASLTDRNGRPVPGISPAALQMGRHAARLIAAEVRAARRGMAIARPAFAYRDKGAMATIGRSRAVASIHGVEFSGPVAWGLWLVVHLLFLIGFRNKLSVLMQWIYSYATYRPGARVIHGVALPSHPQAAAFTPLPRNQVQP